MHILAVDDSDIMLRCLQKTLVQAGHTVDTASNGHEALQRICQTHYRVVISDWDMPGMDGLTLCRHLRTNSSTYVYFILVTSHNSAADTVTGLAAGADEFISKPFRPAELLVRIRIAERLLAMETRDVMLFAMAKLAESRDADTGQHVERVREYSQLLARQLWTRPKFSSIIDESFVRLIYETSPLHDIGKVGIPDNVLLKPGKLTPEEFGVMQQHTVIGKETLDAALDRFPDAQFLRFARDIVAGHHERYDGSGYPYGLAGEEIPLCARVVALADVYDALTSKRVYKRAFSHQESRQIILDESGSHFDPDIVEAFQAVERQFAEISQRFGDVLLPVSAESSIATPCPTWDATDSVIHEVL